MPKSNKPAGGRPAKNFEPRKSNGKKLGSRTAVGTADARNAKAGSRSPKHRGFREEVPSTGKKARWSADERTAAGLSADRRSPSERAPRSNRSDDRRSSGERTDRFDAAGRAPKRAYGERAPRSERVDNDRTTPRRPALAPRRRAEPTDAPRSSARKSDFYPEKTAKFTPADDVVLERLEAQAVSAGEVSDLSFADLGLGGNIVGALAELGAASPFPIQAATIPAVLTGRDVLGRGRTGSGKTIAFGAPTVERLMQNRGGTRREFGRSPRALILAPTRELALQIDRTVQPIARSVGLFTTQIFGGVPQGRQVGALQRGVDIVIGTPGRIEDLIKQGKLDLSQVEITVLDEADHMCDLGFLEPVQRILKLTKPDSQKLLFSATLDRGVAALVNEFLSEPAVFEVAGEDQDSGTIEHRVLVVQQSDKRDVILQLANRSGKTLIFSRTRRFAEDLSDYLEDNGVLSVSLHGDLNQNRRTRNLGMLERGRVNVLVATDVAARGIHVDDIDLVIQADAPDEYKTYLHRSGRTGRAGKLGRVVTLIPAARERRMADLLGRAEIEAKFEPVQSGDWTLRNIAAGK